MPKEKMFELVSDERTRDSQFVQNVITRAISEKKRSSHKPEPIINEPVQYCSLAKPMNCGKCWYCHKQVERTPDTFEEEYKYFCENLGRTVARGVDTWDKDVDAPLDCPMMEK